MSDLQSSEVITLGGGCFWCTEAVFERVRGVLAVEPGYCNGSTHQPSYEQVCSGRTGHVEVVRIRFDPTQVSLRQLLAVFFCIHDPTSLNRQGADEGTQYRSGIYVEHEAQATLAREMIAEVAASLGKTVVTEVQTLSNYWAAEAYHQRYFARHPEQGYCVFVVAGKVEKYMKQFKELVRDSE